MNKITVNKLNEVIYHETLDNGLNVYIYNKSGFNKKTACFATKYGSNNFEFIPMGEEKIKKYPKGIAHFLEHKLFESSDDEHTFAKFEKYGATVNAYTNHFETCYYFYTANNFKDCLNLLLDFVQTPHFTDDNVEKEKGIINQEINMTNDKIPYVIYMKTLENSLTSNPNKNPTIGDKQNVNKITKEDLYDCYNTFYHPSNMILTIAGDVDVEETLKEIKKNQENKNFREINNIVLPEYNETKHASKEYEHIIKNVSSPRVSVCYKMIMPKVTKIEKVKREIFFNMLFDLKFGSTSDFKRKLIDEKIIKSNFSCNYESFDDVVLFIFEADIIDKDEFIKKVEQKLKENTFDKKVFDLNKKSYLVSMVRAFENPGFIANKIYEDIVRYGEFTNYAYDVYQELCFDEFVSQAKELNFDNKSVIYVTKDKEE